MIYPFEYWWALGCFQVGATMYGTAANILEPVFGGGLPTVLLGIFLQVGWLVPLRGTSSIRLARRACEPTFIERGF